MLAADGKARRPWQGLLSWLLISGMGVGALALVVAAFVLTKGSLKTVVQLGGTIVLFVSTTSLAIHALKSSARAR